jgi:galactitol-specific phosphotransferase system IIC component
MVPVDMGSDNVASQEHHGIVEIWHAIFTRCVGILYATLTILGTFGEVAAQLLLLLTQDVDAKSADFLQKAESVGAVGDAYQHNRGFHANRSE